MTEKKPIGKILLRQRALPAEELDRALAERGQERLASKLAREGRISDTAALKALSEQHGIPGIDLSRVCLNLRHLDLLPREIAEKHRILPVLEREDRLFVAMADPREKTVIDELEFVTGKRVYPYVALESSLSVVIDESYARKLRGESYYVGEQCPKALLDKLGIDENGEPLGTDSTEPGMLSSPSAAPSLAPDGVVVDDGIGSASQATEIEERDFGDVAGEAPEYPVVAVPSEQPASELGEGAKTVLVVDDELEIRKMVARLLTRAGHRVLEADRGLAALQIVKDQPLDLIVLDAMLPEVHGFEIAKRIKHSELYRHVPIIMVSAVYKGWRFAEDLRQSCGVDHFIEKPFRIADVLTAVNACLSSTRGASPASRDLSAEAEHALNAGIEAYRGGRPDEAIDHLRRGIGIDPLAFRLHFHLGLLYGKKGQTFDAIAALESSIESNGQYFPALKNLAILYQKAGFRNRAVEMWERALPLAPDEPTRQSIRQHLLQLL